MAVTFLCWGVTQEWVWKHAYNRLPKLLNIVRVVCLIAQQELLYCYYCLVMHKLLNIIHIKHNPTFLLQFVFSYWCARWRNSLTWSLTTAPASDNIHFNRIGNMWCGSFGQQTCKLGLWTLINGTNSGNHFTITSNQSMSKPSSKGYHNKTTQVTGKRNYKISNMWIWIWLFMVNSSD